MGHFEVSQRIAMYFTESHEWISLQSDKKIGSVGITDHAQKELGEIVFIELPRIGHRVKRGEEVAVLESTKAAADVYAPLSGKIVAVNEALRKDPSLLNRAPESTGWLFQIEITDPKELQNLLGREEYLRQIAGG